MPEPWGYLCKAWAAIRQLMHPKIPPKMCPGAGFILSMSSSYALRELLQHVPISRATWGAGGGNPQGNPGSGIGIRNEMEQKDAWL